MSEKPQGGFFDSHCIVSFCLIWLFINLIFYNRPDSVCLCVLLQEDQLGLSLLTLEQLESEESQKKIESQVHQQWWVNQWSHGGWRTDDRATDVNYCSQLSLNCTTQQLNYESRSHLVSTYRPICSFSHFVKYYLDMLVKFPSLCDPL